MNREQFLIFVAVFALMCSTKQSGSAHAATVSSSTVIQSVSSVSVGGSHAEAVISGPHGTISLNGDRVEVRDGKLTVNGVSYGTVGKNSVVKYTVHGSVKKLFVDGVERLPDP
jgi:hypothetical protein